MNPANKKNQFGDTTYTKVFVGGLAWETQKETMRNYFEQFGDILEAVVISDRNTGRSKGYGFVTFSEPEAAMRACVDPAPVIDRRRANCNLASLGVQKSTPNGSKKGIRVMKSFTAAAGLQAFPTAAAPPAVAAGLPHYAIGHQGIPYNVYGYPPYSADYNHPMSYSYYNVYNGSTAGAQYAMYGTGAYYPYLQVAQQQSGAGTVTAYGSYNNMHYHHHHPHIFQYYSGALASSTTAVAGFAQHYGVGPFSFAPSSPAQQGMTLALTTPADHHYKLLLPPHFLPSEQPLA